MRQPFVKVTGKLFIFCRNSPGSVRPSFSRRQLARSTWGVHSPDGIESSGASELNGCMSNVFRCAIIMGLSLLLSPQITAMPPWPPCCPRPPSRAPLSLRLATPPALPGSTEETVSRKSTKPWFTYCISARAGRLIKMKSKSDCLLIGWCKTY